jgi:trehalose-6-phosphatase
MTIGFFQSKDVIDQVLDMLSADTCNTVFIVSARERKLHDRLLMRH